MTLGECKQKALKLIDEYSNGGTPTRDEDFELRMRDHADQGQKYLAQIKKVVKVWVPELPELAEDGEQSQRPPYGLVWIQAPGDFVEVFRLWKDGKAEKAKAYRWRNRALALDASEVGKIEVEYFAMPSIPEDATDDYEIALAPDAAECLPYWVGWHLLLVDLVTDYKPVQEIFMMMLNQLDTRLPSDGTGGGIRQSLYSSERR